MAISTGAIKLREWWNELKHGEKLHAAAAIGVYPTHISRICDGHSTPNVFTCFRIEETTKGRIKARDFVDVIGSAGEEQEAA
jgi:DNA-binding transcriptional regulator YdaS (Cro superfamily)